MQVCTTSIQVHVIPKKPALQLHETDRDAVGVYGVDVDIMDYPLQQATAALNAFTASVTLTNAVDFELHIFDPQKKSWLIPSVGHVDFPSDAVFTGKLDVPLLPVGTRLIGKRDEVGQRGSGVDRSIQAGAAWDVIDIDRGSICLASELSGASIFASVCQLGTDFKIDYGFSDEVELTAEQLDEKYYASGVGEHPMFSLLMWREAVANEDTISGYWVWARSGLAQAKWTS